MHKIKVTVLENEHVELGCPISGIPEPDIAWLVNGELLEKGITTKHGVMLAPGGKSVSSQVLQYSSINFYVKLSNFNQKCDNHFR